MKYVANLLVAMALTLTLGVGLMQIGDAYGLQAPGLGPVLLVASGLAGVAVLARQHRRHLAPIAAIYIVVMSGIIIFLAHLIAWYRGQVEF